MEETVYFVFSGITALVAVIAVFAAKRAMRRGLTYSAMAATMWALIFFAIGRIWHTFREMEHPGGEWPELLEYAIYTAGYILFIWLTAISHKVDLPPRNCPPTGGKPA